MSNGKVERAQIKFDVPAHIKRKMEEVAAETGFTMTMIFCMLVQYYLVSPLDVEHDVRRMLADIAKRNEKALKLSPRQKKVIADATEQLFTRELI